MKRRIEKLANDAVSDPVRIVVGGLGEVRPSSSLLPPCAAAGGMRHDHVTPR